MSRKHPCTKCTSRHATMFAFVDGKAVYACRRHWQEIKIDAVVDWQRLSRVWRVE